MAETKYHGKNTVVLWQKDYTGAPVNLTGTSRSVSYNQTAQAIDVSTRDDYMENTKQNLADIPTRQAQVQGIDTRSSGTRAWYSVDIDDVGYLFVYPEGTAATGLPYHRTGMRCLQANWASPHDNAATWDIQMESVSSRVDATIAS